MERKAVAEAARRTNLMHLRRHLLKEEALIRSKSTRLKKVVVLVARLLEAKRERVSCPKEQLKNNGPSRNTFAISTKR